MGNWQSLSGRWHAAVREDERFSDVCEWALQTNTEAPLWIPFQQRWKKYHKKTNKPKAYGLRESDLEACLVFASWQGSHSATWGSQWREMHLGGVCVCKRTEGETSQVFGVMSLNVRLRYMDYCSQIFGFRYTSNIDRRRDPALICQRSYRWTIFFFNPSGIDIFLNTKLFINLLSSAANLFCCFGFILIYFKCPFNK